MEELYQNFPEFRSAYENRIEVDVSAGEVIVIPPFVWHYVVTDELCMNFSFHSLLEQILIFSFSFLSALAVNFFTDTEPEDFSCYYHRLYADNLHNTLYHLLCGVPPKDVDHLLNEMEHLFIK
jgi:hypothetical protein